MPMASGLVKRVVEKGDIFLVIENTIYAANVSWGGIRQEVRRATLWDILRGCSKIIGGRSDALPKKKRLFYVDVKVSRGVVV